MLTIELRNKIINDLFFEQEHDELSIAYKHGILRTVFIIFRSVLFSKLRGEPLSRSIKSGGSVAVVMSTNCLRAISSAPKEVGVQSIINLNLRSLSMIREQLGLWQVISEILYFIRTTIEIKGIKYIQRMSIPILGWLLFKTFISILESKSKVTITTTNMVHAVPVGIAWAVYCTGHRSQFFEHAVTPTIIMANRGYDLVYVNFEHTRRQLIMKGFEDARIRVMHQIDNNIIRLKNVAISRVAICINEYDSLHTIKDITDVFRTHDVAITFRLHEADSRHKAIRQIATTLNIPLSFAKQSSIKDFLIPMDLVIAGNSNVIADAMLARRLVIYYWAGQERLFDYFGFVQYYSILHANSVQALQKLAHQIMQSRDNGSDISPVVTPAYG